MNRSAAGRRCLDHADTDIGQHQRAVNHDWREGRKDDSGVNLSCDLRLRINESPLPTVDMSAIPEYRRDEPTFSLHISPIREEMAQGIGQGNMEKENGGPKAAVLRNV
jgi:hypothetical protein